MSDTQQWVEVKNEKTGGVYYFNKIVSTNQSSFNLKYRQESHRKTNQEQDLKVDCKLKRVCHLYPQLTKCQLEMRQVIKQCLLNRRITRLM